MNTNNTLVFLLCLAMLYTFQTYDRQEKEIKGCQHQIEAIQAYLGSKFPPSDWERVEALGNVIDLGRQLQESLRATSDGERSWLAFWLYDFANKYGGSIKYLTGITIYEPDPKLGTIKQLHAMVAEEAQYLDYALSHDFLDMDPIWSPSFPHQLAYFLDSDVQPAITSLLQTSPDKNLHFLLPSPTPAHTATPSQ